MLLTCQDKCVGNSGLREHALYVATEQLQSLASSTERVQQYHYPAGPTHLHIRHTWDRRRRQVQRSGKKIRGPLLIRYFKECAQPRPSETLWRHHETKRAENRCNSIRIKLMFPAAFVQIRIWIIPFQTEWERKEKVRRKVCLYTKQSCNKQTLLSCHYMEIHLGLYTR